MYQITCPYCFKTFDDTDVKFRSEFVNLKELDEFEDENLKDEALLFSPGRSKQYEEWWTFEEAPFATSEMDPASGEIQPYERPIIDPASQLWQRLLMPVGVGEDYKSRYLIKDRDGMVAHIKLFATRLHSEIICSRRVCPHCHNPLPENFGKTPIITIPIIGVTNSGKTVYMSSLLKNINSYVVNVGYTGAMSTGGVFSFREMNKVEQNQRLPQPTEASLVQQPLCFVMNKPVAGNRLESYTVVLYDLAGEYFNRDSKQDIHVERKHRRPLLEHADGIILLIDPAQLTGAAEESSAVAALDNIQSVLLDGGKLGHRVKTPIAICVPKADNEQFLNVFGAEIQSYATQSVDYNTHSKKIPAEQYNELNDSLFENMEMNISNGVLPQTFNYEMSRFFAFSAVSGDLIDDGVLTGRPFPQRIEDPLLWLLAKNGYCDVEGNLHRDIKCPNCGSYWTRYEENTSPDKKKPFKKQTYTTFNHICKRCKCMFNADEYGNINGEGRLKNSDDYTI